MENFYLKQEVKKHIDQSYNPNIHLHNFEVPFRALIVAPSGTGKSNFLCNLLKTFCVGKGTFDEIILFCKCRHEPLYEYLNEASKGNIVVTEDISKLPQINTLNKKTQKLYIFDDMVLDKNPLISEYFIRGRKMGVSLLFLTQSFYQTPKIIRQNTRYFIILKLSGARDLSMILKELSITKTKNELLAMYEYATQEKFDCFIIDNDAVKNKYRKNFTEYLD
jgi:hypothetical protein